MNYPLWKYGKRKLLSRILWNFSINYFILLKMNSIHGLIVFLKSNVFLAKNRVGWPFMQWSLGYSHRIGNGANLYEIGRNKSAWKSWKKGHLGLFKTTTKIRKPDFWPKMRKDMKKFVASCENCQQCKMSQQKTPGKCWQGSPKHHGRQYAWTLSDH